MTSLPKPDFDRRSGGSVSEAAADIRGHHRPHPNLLAYYCFASLVLGPFFFLALIPRYFRFRTLRYTFDDEGVTMRWGVLFRREISLTYPRVQDIHLTSNILERWLGLARIQVQTAAGSATAEMTIEGLQSFEEVRDFLYSRMRAASSGGNLKPAVSEETPEAELGLAATLEAVAAELRALRLALEKKPSTEHRS
jgi:putative membrane protein